MAARPLVRRAGGVVGATALAFSLTTASAPPVGATYPGNTGRIFFGAFDPEAGFQADVYSVNKNGVALHQLTSGPARDICPALSADGRHVALCSDRTGDYEIWTMRANGKQLTQLTELGGFAIFPDWSPDGRRIAFTFGDDGDSATTLRVVDVRSGDVSPLVSTPAGHSDAYPVWSPDGSQIVFVRQQVEPDEEGFLAPVSGQLWVLEVATGQTRQLTSDPTLKDQVPDWSPDGTRIAYEAGDDLWLMDADGTDQVNLTRTPDAVEFGAAFSPDGSRIAFTGTGGPVPAGERYVQTIRLDGTDREVVAPTPGLLQAVPAWQSLGRGQRR